MSYSHREEERDDKVFDVITDEERGLRLVVARLVPMTCANIRAR